MNQKLEVQNIDWLLSYGIFTDCELRYRPMPSHTVEHGCDYFQVVQQAHRLIM